MLNVWPKPTNRAHSPDARPNLGDSPSEGTGGLSRRDAPFPGPGLAEFHQRLRAQQVLGHLEKDAIFEVEFLARELDHAEQAALGILLRARPADQTQAVADGVVLMLHRLELAHLV